VASALEASAVAVETAVRTAWAQDATIAWPNVPFTPPDHAKWLRVDWVWGGGFIETKGASGYNTIVGVLQLTVFVPKDTGEGPLWTLVDTMRDAVNRKSLGDVRFAAPSGPVFTTEPKWRGAVITAPFTILGE
jgi:hypothetical protein